MAALLVVAGVVAVLVIVLDVLWTVAAAGSGAGPLTGRLSAAMWRLALAAGRGSRGPRHRFLAAAGISIVVGVLLVWILLVWASWWLVLSASEGAVHNTAEQRPASLVERAHFAGGSIFGLASDGYAAGEGAWQFATIGATATGVVFVTLAITYLVPVASAVAERRQFAAYVSSLGGTPEEVLVSAWTGTDFGSLRQHLIALTPMVHLLGERQLAYPVLHYFHSGRERTAGSSSTVLLDEVVTVLRHGVAPGIRPDRAALDPLAQAIGLFLDTMRSAFINPGPHALPAPDLGPLRDAGVPTVGDEEFAAALKGDEERRRLLAGLLRGDGWSAEGWRQRSARGAT